MYGKLVSGQLCYPPVDLIVDDKVILNFDTNEALLEQYGYKLVIREIPEYDKDTQYLSISGYSENDTQIFTNYVVVNKNLDPEEQLKQKIKELEDETKMLKECLMEMSSVVYG